MSQQLLPPQQKTLKLSEIVRSLDETKHIRDTFRVGVQYCVLGGIGLYLERLYDQETARNVYRELTGGARAGLYNQLMCMNDQECKTFAEIADWLESVGK